MGLHDGHRQRSKRRYLALGAEGMEDHQLLELLLFYAIPRQDTNETAHRLIQRFWSGTWPCGPGARPCPRRC